MYPGPGPGRPKGKLNKTTSEVRAAARSIIDDPAYKDSLRLRLIAGDAPHMETLLWHYAYGKPKETVEIQQAPVDVTQDSAEELRLRSLQLVALTSQVSQPESYESDTVN